MFGLSAIDAAKKLNDDFNLGISFDYEKEYHKPKYSEDAEIREIKRKKRERFEKWEHEAYQAIHDYWWLVKEWYETLKPPKMEFVPENYQFDEHKEEEKPQSTESPRTYIDISNTKSPNSIPVNW